MSANPSRQRRVARHSGAMLPWSVENAAIRLAHHIAGLRVYLDTGARRPRVTGGVRPAQLIIYSAHAVETRTIRRAA